MQPPQCHCRLQVFQLQFDHQSSLAKHLQCAHRIRTLCNKQTERRWIDTLRCLIQQAEALQLDKGCTRFSYDGALHLHSRDYALSSCAILQQQASISKPMHSLYICTVLIQIQLSHHKLCVAMNGMSMVFQCIGLPAACSKDHIQNEQPSTQTWPSCCQHTMTHTHLFHTPACTKY